MRVSLVPLGWLTVQSRASAGEISPDVGSIMAY